MTETHKLFQQVEIRSSISSSFILNTLKSTHTITVVCITSTDADFWIVNVLPQKWSGFKTVIPTLKEQCVKTSWHVSRHVQHQTKLSSHQEILIIQITPTYFDSHLLFAIKTREWLVMSHRFFLKSKYKIKHF